jgi:hypothetical protein
LQAHENVYAAFSSSVAVFPKRKQNEKNDPRWQLWLTAAQRILCMNSEEACSNLIAIPKIHSQG